MAMDRVFGREEEGRSRIGEAYVEESGVGGFAAAKESTVGGLASAKESKDYWSVSVA